MCVCFGFVFVLDVDYVLQIFRPDISIMPPNMEDWDHGHTTFVSTVQMMLHREMVFILNKVEQNGAELGLTGAHSDENVTGQTQTQTEQEMTDM